MSRLILVSCSASSGGSGALAVTAGGHPHRYRGSIELAAGSEGRLRIVNVVAIEDYLRGVVPMEMSPSAPAEALKAQAVAARSYALRLRGRYASLGYDLTDSTDSQVYGGVDSEKTSTDAAVRDTAGLVLYRDGKPLLADYYDDCGGITSPGADEDDYPPSVSDAPPDGGPEYCTAGVYHRWALKLTAEELAKCLTPSERRKLGPIADVRVSRTDSSGRAIAVDLQGTVAPLSVRGSILRARIGYDRLKSTLITVSKESDGVFLFSGKGYGHGHGMCQSGAIGMAAVPYRYPFREILAHYFPGSTVRPFPTG